MNNITKHSVFALSLLLNLVSGVASAQDYGQRPAPSTQDNPSGGNPLGGQDDAPPPAPANPFLRKFSGPEVELEIRAQDERGYHGELRFRGKAYPLRAEVRGMQMRGVFRVGARDFAFGASLQGDILSLQSGGRSYQLKGAPQAGAGNPLGGGENPLGGGGRGGSREEPIQRPIERPIERPAEEEDDVRDIPERDIPAPGTKPFVNAPSGVACQLPEKWSVIHQGPDGVAFNPGYARGQTLNVSVSLHAIHAPAEQGEPAIDQLLMAELDSFRDSLAGNGVIAEAPRGRAQLFRVQGKPAASIVLPARTRAGQQGQVWLALRRDGDTILACAAVYLNGEERKFGPQVEAVFASLRPAARR
jgi:hypothetical protein